MKSVIAALLLFTMPGLMAEDAIKSREEAVEAFRLIARKIVEDRTGKKAPEDTGRFSPDAASERSSQELYDRVVNTLLPKQYSNAIKVGSVDALKPDRKVWVIGQAVDVFLAWEAVLDAKDGKLIFVWYIPEG